MNPKAEHYGKRMLALTLAILITIGTILSNQMPVFAAAGTLTFNSGETISYGDYFTTRMTFDGSNTAYCVEPLKSTPQAGTYEYDLLGNDSPVRKALYYLPGGYGYDANIKGYLSGWSDDNAYVIGHLVVAYIYAGYDAGSGAFYGAPQSYIDKAVEVTNAINSLPAPPDSFRAFIVPGNGSQTIAGSWYAKPYGWIELQKSSANTAISDGNASYSLKGARYGVYKDSELVATLVTDKNGYAKSGELEEGSYVIRELEASQGYALDTGSYNVQVKSDVTATVAVKEIPQNQPISLLLQKLDADTKEAAPQGAASLAGAQFTVKFYTKQSNEDPAANSEKPERTWIFQTDSSGKVHFTKDYLVSGDEFYFQSDGKTIVLPLGTVTIQETKAPVGYSANNSVFVQKITSEGTAETISVYNAASVEEPVYRGGVTIQKRDLETANTEPQGSATLEGAEFAITTLNEQPVVVGETSYTKDQVVLTLKTNGAGIAASEKDALPFGHYRIDEITPPTGYLNEGQISIEFDISENSQMVELVAEDQSVLNQVIRGGIKIQKRDLETKEAAPQGSATLEGAVFTITTLNEHPVLVNGEAFIKNQVVMTLKTDKTGITSTAKDALPFGHYRIDEIKAPEGYLNEGILSIEFDIVEDGKIVELTAEDHSILNQVIRGDLEFVKVSDSDLNRLANVPFTITSKTTGESHTLVTDKNGYASTASSWNKHTSNTNRGETSRDGIWFGTSEPNDEKGALIYDTYTIKEQSCETNKGMNLLEFDVTVYKDSVTIDLGTLTDDRISISTTVVDKDTKSHFSKPKKKVTLVDTVEYEGLKRGKEYKVIGTLMDKESGEVLLIDEKPVTSETTFTAKKTSGSVKVTFTFNGVSLKNKTIVVFEELYQGETKLAVHADITDTDQTIYFPEIGTTARDADTQENLSNADAEVTLIDTVSYSNLLPGQEYELTGTLMDKETGKAVTADGKEITAKTTFTPEESNGSAEVTFTFDGTALQGKTTVIFESLAYDGKEIAVHADITDKRQTIYFPEISTTATDAETGTHVSRPQKEITLTDTVSFKNLQPGKEYKVAGVLMDKETEKELLVDDKSITAETVFTPEEPEGTVELTFTFNGSALTGKTLVAFETVTYKEKEVAVHADINDKAQTIYFPEIGTSAKDGDDGDQEALADSEVTIIDTVTYHNLVAGETYKVSGILMDKETGKAIEAGGKQVTAEAEFKAEASDGSVEVIFTFDGTALDGHDVVVFEKLYLSAKDKDIEIASHQDIEDEGQTVKLTEVPKEPPKETPSVSSPVKTGDDTNIHLYLGIAGAALAVAVVLSILYYKKRKKDDSET